MLQSVCEQSGQHHFIKMVSYAEATDYFRSSQIKQTTNRIRANSSQSVAKKIGVHTPIETSLRP